MFTTLKNILVAPHVVIFFGVLIIILSEVFRFQGDPGDKRAGLGLFLLITGLVATGFGGYWSAKQQADFNDELINTITGGDSYCYLDPYFSRSEDGSGNSVYLFHEGKYPLSGISVHINRFQYSQDPNVDVPRLISLIKDIPALAPGEKRYLGDLKYYDGVDHVETVGFIYHKGGSFRHTFVSKRIDGEWHNSEVLWKRNKNEGYETIIDKQDPALPINY